MTCMGEGGLDLFIERVKGVGIHWIEHGMFANV
jgi:hypothetical protein